MQGLAHWVPAMQEPELWWEALPEVNCTRYGALIETTNLLVTVGAAELITQHIRAKSGDLKQH